MKPSLIVHGGAWNIPDEAVDACKSGCHRALAAGWAILSRAGSALDAIEAAIMDLEDDPIFDVRYGSQPNIELPVNSRPVVNDGPTVCPAAAAHGNPRRAHFPRRRWLQDAGPRRGSGLKRRRLCGGL